MTHTSQHRIRRRVTVTAAATLVLGLAVPPASAASVSGAAAERFEQPKLASPIPDPAPLDECEQDNSCA